MPDPCSARLTIEIADRQDMMPVNEEQLCQAVRQILLDAEIIEAEISIAIVNNHEIHELNNRFLKHDYPTDVISFPLEVSPGRLEGEIVASAEMAITQAAEAGWTSECELLLYVIHGALHLVGHDDHDPEREVEMRAAERHYLQSLGISLPSQDGLAPDASQAASLTASASPTSQSSQQEQ